MVVLRIGKQSPGTQSLHRERETTVRGDTGRERAHPHTGREAVPLGNGTRGAQQHVQSARGGIENVVKSTSF